MNRRRFLLGVAGLVTLGVPAPAQPVVYITRRAGKTGYYRWAILNDQWKVKVSTH